MLEQAAEIAIESGAQATATTAWELQSQGRRDAAKAWRSRQKVTRARHKLLEKVSENRSCSNLKVKP